MAHLWRTKSMVKPGHQKICTPESHCSGCRAVDACVPAENPGLLNTRLLPVFVPRNLKGIRLNDPAAGLLSASYALTKIMCIVLHFFLSFFWKMVVRRKSIFFWRNASQSCTVSWTNCDSGTIHTSLRPVLEALPPILICHLSPKTDRRELAWQCSISFS